MSRAQRARCYCFTLNNYVEGTIERLRAQAATIFKYFICGKEVGEQGTPHLQMYGETITRTTIIALKGKLVQLDPDLNRVHVEIAAGNAQQNIIYCSKEGDFFEIGDRPLKNGEKSSLKAASDLIMDGAAISEVITAYPHVYVQYGSGLTRLMCSVHSKRNFMTIGFWLYGKTGAGKSKWAAENFPEAYWKPSLDKWFDGYMMENVVIIDDYRPTQDLSFEYMLRLVDRYPLMVQTKGAFVPFVPKILIVTSPRDISETFSHLSHQEDLDQLTRRFPHRLCFDHGHIDHFLQLLNPDELSTYHAPRANVRLRDPDADNGAGSSTNDHNRPRRTVEETETRAAPPLRLPSHPSFPPRAVDVNGYSGDDVPPGFPTQTIFPATFPEIYPNLLAGEDSSSFGDYPDWGPLLSYEWPPVLQDREDVPYG